ncbi:unnamed protein product [Cylicocyclus nassatus]|uniref:Choline transporter-like protein n=1 Tax=Cylicocyclus nassatus TaxID=53992 RepID=A0AA36HBZ5_CYLNA|nr:unnamed protein product [Cylicocyclus nassatus]
MQSLGRCTLGVDLQGLASYAIRSGYLSVAPLRIAGVFGMCCSLGCCCVGDASDENYENLLHKGRRSCTDCSFLILFLIFCGGLGSIAWFAVDNGDPYRILYGSDSFGNTCGRNNGPIFIRSNKTDEKQQFEYSGQNMTERRFMFPLNASKALDTVWTCVRSCPEATITSYREIKNLALEQNNSLCVDHQSAIDAAEQKPRYGTCPRLPVLKSISILNRCIPEDLVTFGRDLLQKVVELDWIRGYLHDLIDTSPFLLQMCLVALALSLVSIALLRFFAAAIIYFIYLAVALLAIGFSGSIWYAIWKVRMNSLPSLGGDNATEATTATLSDHKPYRLTAASLFNDQNLSQMFNLENTTTLTLFAVGIGATVISIFIVAAVWCVLPRGKKMIRLFKGASKALSAMPSLLLQPLVNAALILMVAIYTLSVVLVLFTSGDLVSRRITNGDNRNESILIIETNMTQTTKIMMFYQLVGFIWVSEFFMACQRLFIAGAVSMYYFDVLSLSRRFASPTPRSPVMCSLWNLIRYHLGSAALGAFIITLVRVPRYIVIWTLARMRSVENVIIKKLLAVFVVLLGCIEKCLRYINYNVYTVISYSGFSFCPAAKMAVNHLLDNAVDVATVNTVGDLVLFLAKCLVAGATTLCAFFRLEELWPRLSHPWFPLLIMFLCSYQISNCFLSVYEMTVDTIMLCCAEELLLLKDNPELLQQYREYIDGTSEMSGQKNVRFIGATTIEESYPLNTVEER